MIIIYLFIGEFGSFEWSTDEEKVLYIAEKKIPKSEPFLTTKSPNKKPEEATKVVI